MNDNQQQLSRLAAALGILVLLALGVFLSTGGRLGGTQTVENDADLPQVVSPAPPNGSDNTGTR